MHFALSFRLKQNFNIGIFGKQLVGLVIRAVGNPYKMQTVRRIVQIMRVCNLLVDKPLLIEGGYKKCYVRQIFGQLRLFFSTLQHRNGGYQQRIGNVGIYHSANQNPKQYCQRCSHCL